MGYCGAGFACGPSQGGEDPSGDNGATTTEAEVPSDPSATTTTTAAGTTPLPESTETGDATGTTALEPDDGGSDEASTGEAPESVCDPQPEGVSLHVVVDGIDDQYEHVEVDLDLPCTITNVTNTMPGESSIVLQCTEDGVSTTHTLDIASTPSIQIPVAVGAQVQFHLFTFIPWWGDVYVTLRDDAGGLLFGSFSAGYLFDGCCDHEPDASMFAPVTVSTASEACELDCTESMGISFIVDPCPCERRRAFDFATDEGSVRVHDRGTGVLPGYDLVVGRSVSWAGTDGGPCEVTDSPHGWSEAVIVRQP